MDFSGNWNEPRPTADWDDARPQRPVNPDLSFDLTDDLVTWNQSMLQQSDAGYRTRPLRGATQQGDTSSDPLRAPIQRPTAPFTPVVTEDLSNGGWDSQEGRPPQMNEQINQLRQRCSSLTSTVQDLSSAVHDLGITVRGLTRTIRGLGTDQSNMERRLNARTQSLEEYVETIAEWVDKCLKDHVRGGPRERSEPRRQGEEGESK